MKGLAYTWTNIYNRMSLETNDVIYVLMGTQYPIYILVCY